MVWSCYSQFNFWSADGQIRFVKTLVNTKYWFSPCDREFIDQEIDHLLHEGIIELSSSPWPAQVLVVHNDISTHWRSWTINKYTILDACRLSNLNELVHKVAQFSIYSWYDLKSAAIRSPYMRRTKSIRPLKPQVDYISSHTHTICTVGGPWNRLKIYLHEFCLFWFDLKDETILFLKLFLIS